MKNLTRFTPATPARLTGLSALLTEAFSVDSSLRYPVVYALGVLTGLPGYPALPVAVAACEAGLSLFTLTGYYVGGYVPLPASLVTAPNGVALGWGDEVPGHAVYYAALGVLRALPSRLTVSALTALGVDFSDAPTGPVPAPAFTADALGAVTVTPAPTFSPRPFTESDWVTYGGAISAPNGTPPVIADGVATPGYAYGATAIADATGVSVTFYPGTVGGDFPETAEYYVSLTPNGEETDTALALGATLVAGLPAALTPAYVTALGFTRLG